MKYSVVLVDDQTLLRQGFRMILEAEDDLEVIGEAGDGQKAIDLALHLRPNVVAMDIRMPGVDGIEATRRIIEADPRIRVLVLTTFDLDEYAFGALRAGASGFLLKDVQPSAFVAAIRSVASGDAVISPRMTRRLLEEFSYAFAQNEGGDDQSRLSVLTDRERDVFLAVAAGLSNFEIGEKLFVSETTVKSHVGRILTKLQLRDRVQIVILAYELGLRRPGVVPVQDEKATSVRGPLTPTAGTDPVRARAKDD